MNLIPSDMAVPATAVKLAKFINKISTIASLLLFILLLFAGALFFYYSSESSKQTTRISNLKAKINSLQQNEQKLILAKDRLSKIEAIQQSKSVNQEVIRFKEFSDMVTLNGSVIAEAVLSLKGAEVSLVSENSDKLALVLTPLPEFKNYKTIILTSLGYSAGTGFLSTIVLGNE